jgi:predicted small lipoprotein YifL
MSTAMPRILVFAALAALAGCGQKGPLTLPPPQPTSQSQAPVERPAERPSNRPFPDVPGTNESR